MNQMKYNSTDKIYAKEKTLNQVFEDMVEQIPNEIAIKSEEGIITYKELNVKANKLAHYLVGSGARKILCKSE